MKPIVYFSREITPEKVLGLYRALGKELPGKIAVKVHSGEEGNQNFLHPEFWKSVVERHRRRVQHGVCRIAQLYRAAPPPPAQARLVRGVRRGHS